MEILVRIWFSMLLFSIVGLASAIPSQADSGPSEDAVMLDIIDGETAFIVDPTEAKAWWVVDQCKRPLPMLRDTANTQKNTYKTITSEMILDKVRIGNRQVTLKQQFRFSLAVTPNSGLATVEVYNSLRGGWSPVAVRLNANCTLDATCRNRMEYPEC